MNYFHSAFKIREVNDPSLLSLECYLSFLCFLTHVVNKRCLRQFFQQKFLIQLWYNWMNTLGEMNFPNTHKIPDWLSTRAKPCYFMGLLFYTELVPLSGMKIIWIKLKPVPLRAKNHKCLLVSVYGLIFIKHGISNCSWGQRGQTFFFFLILQVWKNWGISNFPMWTVISGLDTCVKLYQNCSVFSQLSYTVPLDSNSLHTQLT